jgi:hypothetical protein
VGVVCVFVERVAFVLPGGQTNTVLSCMNRSKQKEKLHDIDLSTHSRAQHLIDPYTHYTRERKYPHVKGTCEA